MKGPIKISDEVAGNPASADLFFGSQDFARNIFDGSYLEGLQSGKDFLATLKEQNEQLYSETHKGAAFFWLAIASANCGDFEAAAFFIDAAVSEDIRRGSDLVSSSTPAIGFLRLDKDSPPTLANPTLSKIREVIQFAISRSVRLPGFRPNFEIKCVEEFLKKLVADSQIDNVSTTHVGLRTIATSLITFFLELSDRQQFSQLGVANGTFEPFQLHLLKGCVLFESILRFRFSGIKPTGNRKYLTLGDFLHDAAVMRELDVGEIQSSCDSFQDAVDEWNRHSPNVENAIQLTAKMRNTIAHSMNWDVELGEVDYTSLALAVSASCLQAMPQGSES